MMAHGPVDTFPAPAGAEPRTGGPRPRVGVSACLLGEPVRYDGGHKRHQLLIRLIAPHVELVRVCPEVEVGMGTPREPVHLVRGTDGSVRMVTVRTGIDHTPSMQRWARMRLDALHATELSGFVLKRSSPSCGLEGLSIVDRDGATTQDGRGIFAGALVSRFPHLPSVEEHRLADPELRENFLERVFAYWRLRRAMTAPAGAEALKAFHRAHEMSLRSHCGDLFDELGRFLPETAVTREACEEYERRVMTALSVLPTRSRHADVLSRIAARLNEVVDASARIELEVAIERYRDGLAPLAHPLALLRRQVSATGLEDLAGQVYLEAHPAELMEGFRA